MSAAKFADAAALDRALTAPLFLVFKHSSRCNVSASAFAEYEAFAAARPDVPTAWIDVIAERPWSQRAAELSGVPHESPQAILVRDGRAAWHASHGAVTQRALESAVGPRRG